jgi:transcriptional regulator with PAS, ATPase and Fis domain
MALPVPPPEEPVGRKWLARHGLNDVSVSVDHLRFLRVRGHLHVEDLNSKNGTRLNGEELLPGESVPVPEGAVIRVGDALLVYRGDFLGPDEPDGTLGVLVSPFGLRRLRNEIAQLARANPRNVLVLGGSGSGKEPVAIAIAAACNRSPFYRVNVATVPESTFDAQLFGYVKGAYTGADPRGSRGVFVEQDGGAVFLDEIGDLPPPMQAKLLRVLDHGEVAPLGSVREQEIRKVNVLVIAATNRDLEQMAAQGRFKRDLLARLRRDQIQVPPLRSHAEDVFYIVEALLKREVRPLDPGLIEVDAVEALLRYQWSEEENVRELERVVRAAIRGEEPGSLSVEALGRVLQLPDATAPTDAAILRALDKSGNNKTKAAAALRMGRSALLYRLKRIPGKRSK